MNTPAERDIEVINFLLEFHRTYEDAGYFYGAAHALIQQLDLLYGVNESPLPDVSSECNG